VECLRDTSFGTGLFVNRIPADRDVEDEQGNWLGQRDGWLCAECNTHECDRCGEPIPCDEDITAYDVYQKNVDFSDGAYRVHEECLTEAESLRLLETNF
jgi:hypothetical protein